MSEFDGHAKMSFDAQYAYTASMMLYIQIQSRINRFRNWVERVEAGGPDEIITDVDLDDFCADRFHHLVEVASESAAPFQALADVAAFGRRGQDGYIADGCRWPSAHHYALSRPNAVMGSFLGAADAVRFAPAWFFRLNPLPLVRELRSESWPELVHFYAQFWCRELFETCQGLFQSPGNPLTEIDLEGARTMAALGDVGPKLRPGPVGPKPSARQLSLLSTMPLLDSGEWVTKEEAARTEHVTGAHLGNERKRANGGIMSEDDMSGVDRRFRCWRRRGETPRGKTIEYLRSSLRV